MIEGTAFVTVWVVLGYAFHLSADAYLLLGVPLTAGFQVLVRRRPLRELWVAAAARFTVDTRGAVLAVALAVAPGIYAADAFARGDGVAGGWGVAAVAGAVCAAFALRTGNLPVVLRAAVLPLAVGAGGMIVVLGTAHILSGTPVPVTAAVVAFARSAALYFPATFLLEEVAFRGALDAHVHHDGEARGGASALFVSALWGLWHLPVSSGLPLPLVLLELLGVHILIGIPMSFAWRRTGNLAAPALAHTVIDAVRNALLLGL
jgi:hypothetical protein